jgi:hypothetical protein
MPQASCFPNRRAGDDASARRLRQAPVDPTPPAPTAGATRGDHNKLERIAMAVSARYRDKDGEISRTPRAGDYRTVYSNDQA